MLKLSAATPSPGGLGAEIHYDSGVVRDEDAARLGGWFQTLLDDALRRPEAPAADLALLGEAEHRRAVRDLNATAFPHRATTLVDLWREQAARTPARCALVWRDRRPSYAELRDRVEARSPGACVVSAWRRKTPWRWRVERSPAMVVGMLAILEAGGAYVPLDPAYPQERLTFMG